MCVPSTSDENLGRVTRRLDDASDDPFGDGPDTVHCRMCEGYGVMRQPSESGQAPERLRRLILALVQSTRNSALATAADSFAYKVERFMVTGELDKADDDPDDVLF